MPLFFYRFKDLRKTKKLTQVEMATLLNITTRHYQDCEYGKIDLPTSKLIFLADFFEVSLDYLVGRTDNPEINKFCNQTGVNLMSTTGEKPGKGAYTCTKCGQTVILDDTTDTLPPCPKCSGTDFRP